MQPLSIRTKCPSFYRDECRWQFRKKNPYLAKIKSYPPLSTILLEIYWSINAQSLRTTHWLYNTCFSGVSIQREAAVSPVFHFQHQTQHQLEGVGGRDMQLRSLGVLGLGYHLRGLLGHTHEENWFSLLTVNYKMKTLP